MSQFTDDLLAEVKQSVAADVAAEEARLEAERAARAAAEAQAAREAEAARRAEIDARLEAERHRRRLATEGRRAVVDPVVPPADTPAASPHAARFARPAGPATTPAQPAAPRHGAGFYFVVMGLPMLCITAIVVAWLLNSPQPSLDPVPLPTTADRAAPSGPIPEVAGPGEGAEAVDRRVSTTVADEAGDDAAGGDEAEAAEKKESAAARKARLAREKKRAEARRRAAEARRAEKEAEDEKRGTLDLGKDFMQAD